MNGFVSIGLMAALAVVTKSPFVFPSLGPTAFLFFYTRRRRRPRRATILGHSIGIAVAYMSLLITGLTHAGPATATGVTLARAIAAALSLGLTAGLMVLARAPHPPAGATTLIVSLGILSRPPMLLVLLGGVVLLTLQAILINRLAGVDYPLWAPRQARPSRIRRLLRLLDPRTSLIKPPVAGRPRTGDPRRRSMPSGHLVARRGAPVRDVTVAA